MQENNNIENRLDRIEKLLLSQKTVLNFEELVEYTRLSQSYLYKLTSKGDIPFYRPNPLTSKTTNIVYKIPAEIKGAAYYRPGRSSKKDLIELGNIE